jgi:hypothetical protein
MRGLTPIERDTLLKCCGSTTVKDGKVISTEFLSAEGQRIIPLLITQGRIHKWYLQGVPLYETTAQGKVALHYDEQSKRTFSFT